MYLYVDKSEALTRVPDALLERFGEPVLVTHLLLTSEKKLARAEAGRVITQIEETGFYLQMPPVRESYMAEINSHNRKLV